MRNAHSPHTLAIFIGLACALLTLQRSALAQSQPENHFTPQEIAKDACWIDAKTGRRVRTGPVGWNPGNLAASIPPNSDERHVSFGGRNFVNMTDGSWIDSSTGQTVGVGPVGWNPGNLAASIPPNSDDRHVSFGGRNFVRVPCPARAAAKIPSKKTHAVVQKGTARKSGIPAAPEVPSVGLVIPLMHRGGDGHCDDQMIGIHNMATPCK